MMHVPTYSVILWIVLGACVGLFFGVRLATYVHYRRLKGALCDKCVKGFWHRYNNDANLL